MAQQVLGTLAARQQEARHYLTQQLRVTWGLYLPVAQPQGMAFPGKTPLLITDGGP